MSSLYIVVDLISNGNWGWPIDWNSKFPKLNNVQVPMIQDQIKDEAVWVSNDGKTVSFAIKNVWKDMCCNEPKVPWMKVVWFSQCIPRHSFVLWMAVKGKLLTQDKVAKWKPNEVMRCSLCNQCSDSHNHLFFTCSFSKTIWDALQDLMNKKLTYDWTIMINEVSRMITNNNIWSILRRLVIGAAVYFIWQERNGRLFRQSKRDESSLTLLIIETVKMKMMSFKVKDSIAFRNVESLWNIKFLRIV